MCSIPEVHLAVDQQGHEIRQVAPWAAAAQQHRDGGHVVQREGKRQQEGHQRHDGELADNREQHPDRPAHVLAYLTDFHRAAEPKHGEAQDEAHKYVHAVAQRRVPERHGRSIRRAPTRQGDVWDLGRIYGILREV